MRCNLSSMFVGIGARLCLRHFTSPLHRIPRRPLKTILSSTSSSQAMGTKSQVKQRSAQELNWQISESKDENGTVSVESYSGQNEEHRNNTDCHSGMSSLLFRSWWKKCQTAVSNAVDLVMFPEIWNCPYSNDSFPVYCEPIPELGENQNSSTMDSPSFQMMQMAAREHSVYLVGGSIPETHDGKLYNTCCVFDRSGTLIAKHRSAELYCLIF